MFKKSPYVVPDSLPSSEAIDSPEQAAAETPEPVPAPEAPNGITTPVAVVTAAEAAALALTGPQRIAIIQLTSGRTRADAALAAGVTRSTLYRWLNHDPAFQAAYNAWERDVLGTAQAELLAGTRDAVTAVIRAIRAGDARLGWELLKSHGLGQRLHPGPTDVDELQRRHDLETKKQDIARRREQNQVAMDDLTTFDDL